LIVPGEVSELLRQAYYAGGAGWSVCDVSGAVPACHTRRDFGLVPDPSGTNASFDGLWAAAPVEHIGYGAAVVVEDQVADQVAGELYTESSFAFPQPLVAVNPGLQGVYYIDVGGMDVGRNLVVVRALYVDRGSLVGPTWHANVVGFVVGSLPTPP